MKVFKTILSLFLPTKSWKNHPQKLLRKTQIHFFFLLPWAAQTAQTEEFMFQIVAYRPTVFSTGVCVLNKKEDSILLESPLITAKWHAKFQKNYRNSAAIQDYPLIDLHLNFEISSLKYQIW